MLKGKLVTVNFFNDKRLNIVQFARLMATIFGRFTANSQLHLKSFHDAGLAFDLGEVFSVLSKIVI